MSTSARGFSEWLGLCAFALASAVTSLASAQVTQTDAAMTPLPQPVGAAELSLVDDSWAWNSMTQINRDANGVNLNTPILYGTYYSPPTYPQFVTGDAITLNGLFKWRKEALDSVKDAKTAPGYFSAKCGFSGQILLIGGNCQAQFGWYNVTDPNSTTPPTAAQIHSFIPAPATALSCVNDDGKTPKTDGFCPLAWDNLGPRDLSIKRWIPTTFDSGNISNSPDYAGGYVAFAMIGNPAKCPQNKYSMYEHNQRNASGVPWVTTLIYQSTVDPEGFYMAFEDLPMPASGWKDGGSDGDFNDLVFYVSGLGCDGGNQPCNTGQLGACSVGHTDCAAPGETPMCRPTVQKSVEICDNIDNDCDGVIDNGDNLCPDPDKPICFQGTCVGSCGTGEFPCPIGLTCDVSGHCSDPACANVSCTPGTACRNGTCVDPCAGVTCPTGSQCELGQCVNPCAGVTCPASRVCDKGLCVADCGCAGCATGLTCDTSNDATKGLCIDTACATVSCPSGQVCTAGKCKDPCAGVVCPGNGTCSMGTCSTPMPGSGTGATSVGGNGSLNFGGGTGLNFGGSDSSAGGAAGHRSADTTSKGCTCRMSDASPQHSSPLVWLGSVLGVGTWLGRRRKRARCKAA